MRHLIPLALALALGAVGGCVQSGDGADPVNNPLNLFNSNTSGDSSAQSGGASPGTVVASGGSAAQSARVSGEVSASPDFELTGIGGGVAGEELIVGARSTNDTTPYTVVLFDADLNLLMRGTVGGASNIVHILRHDSAELYLGVAAFSGTDGGKYDFTIDRIGKVSVPATEPQVVYLNFAGGSGVKVNRKPAISFGPFDAARLGDAYAGKSAAMKATIVSQMRQDYAKYNVTLVSSDEGPPPAGPYSTLQFGGDDDGLLGLADNVDIYNQEQSQTAVIYVDSFAIYAVMNLDEEEMATMISNVASHELGHLLGLFHTRNPIDLMDTTGTAWQLAGTQDFARVELEQNVFPTGMGNSPVQLADTVGAKPAALVAAELDARPKLGAAKARKLSRAKQLANVELSHKCGTCNHLDD